MAVLPLRCPDQELFTRGFQRIRDELELPRSFPEAVLAEATEVARRGPVFPPGASGERVDRRDLDLVTIDPPGSRDLDQAYHAERRSGGFRVHYAIADVAAFVVPGGPLDHETLERGVTLYSPDLRTPLHPTVLSEDAASLLAGVDRPALLWTIDLDREGRLESARVERAEVRSREQLDYATAQRRIDASPDADDPLALLSTIGGLRQALEAERGAVSLSLPTQEVTAADDGSFRLVYDTALPVENWNAQISLLTGIAAAEIMLDGGMGVLRTLPTPRAETIDSIRRTAQSLGIDWPDHMSYADRVRGLDPAPPAHAAFLTQAARALRGAGYVAFNGERPELTRHSAIAAEYAHVTAPLRRVADRFANEVLLSLCADAEPPEWALAGLDDVPPAMGRGTHRDRTLERALIDFMEVVVLSSRLDETFDAVVVDVDTRDHDARIQLKEPAVVTTIATDRVELGATVPVRLRAVDLDQRTADFELAER